MHFTSSVGESRELLVVAATGPATLGELCGLFGFVRTTAAAAGHTRALLDLRQVEIAFSATDHLALGSCAANEMAALARVASVVDPRYRVGTSEKTAQKMGLTFRTFTDLDEAKEWLAQG